jgi:hypothetical protein
MNLACEAAEELYRSAVLRRCGYEPQIARVRIRQAVEAGDVTFQGLSMLSMVIRANNAMHWLQEEKQCQQSNCL